MPVYVAVFTESHCPCSLQDGEAELTYPVTSTESMDASLLEIHASIHAAKTTKTKVILTSAYCLISRDEARDTLYRCFVAFRKMYPLKIMTR